jgi:membrane fusion protein (multidrug efflux system)
VCSIPLSIRALALVLLLLASPAAAAPGVIAAEAIERPFAIVVEGLGTARANEAIEIRAQIRERIRQIHFEEGQRVRAGTILVELDDRQAAAEVAAARAALVESEGRYRRALELFETNALSESELEQRSARRDADRATLAAAEARLADATLRAPFDGQLGLRRVSPGSLVGPDTVITTLDDTDPIKLDFTVPETSLQLLEPGLAVSAHSAAWPGVEFTGRVESIDTRVDPVSRTVRVRARIPNPEGRLRAGMFLSVRAVRDDVRALLIPEHAIVPEQSRQFTYVIGEDDRLEKREIRTGRRRPGEVEVLDGLAAGERVVVEGTLKARPGDVVEILDLLPPVGANRP